MTSAYQLTPEYRLGDGLHEHRSYAQFVPAKLNVSAHPVEQPTVATPLEGAVVFVAVGGALSPASAATWPRLRRLLNSIRTRVVGSAGRVAHDAGRLLRRSAR